MPWVFISRSHSTSTSTKPGLSSMGAKVVSCPASCSSDEDGADETTCGEVAHLVGGAARFGQDCRAEIVELVEAHADGVAERAAKLADCIAGRQQESERRQAVFAANDTNLLDDMS